MFKRGERETVVYESLATRPAGIINNATEPRVRSCFAGLFNGALREGHLSPSGGLFIGKAECERDWEETWAALRDLGLIEWHTTERPNHPDFGGSTTLVHWKVTEKGWDVREDDIRWFNELMAARARDEESAAVV